MNNFISYEAQLHEKQLSSGLSYAYCVKINYKMTFEQITKSKTFIKAISNFIKFKGCHVQQEIILLFFLLLAGGIRASFRAP